MAQLFTLEIIEKIFDEQARSDEENTHDIIYSGEDVLTVDDYSFRKYINSGVIIPSNINTPFCITDKMALYVSDICVVVENFIPEPGGIISKNDVLLRVRKLI